MVRTKNFLKLYVQVHMGAYAMGAKSNALDYVCGDFLYRAEKQKYVNRLTPKKAIADVLLQ